MAIYLIISYVFSSFYSFFITINKALDNTRFVESYQSAVLLKTTASFSQSVTCEKKCFPCISDQKAFDKTRYPRRRSVESALNSYVIQDKNNIFVAFETSK